VVRERFVRRILSGAGAALVVKALTGVTVAAFAATAAGAAAEATITGSLNPADWGQQVRHQVTVCKAQLAVGEHGIGACVSAFASQHGKLVSADHSASGARLNHGNANANGHSKDKSANGNGNGNGKSQSHGQPSHKPNHTVAVGAAEN
jgi:hypothetical protein